MQQTRTSQTPSPKTPETKQQSPARSKAGRFGNHFVQQAVDGRLPPKVQEWMERSFGADFSSIRVVEDAAAAEHGGRAVAQGETLHFAPGQLDFESEEGLARLGEELAHVLQQRGGRAGDRQPGKGQGVGGSAQLEQEAKSKGKQAAKGEKVGDAGPAGQTQASGRAAQTDAELTDRQLSAAREWATTEHLGSEAIRSLQGALSVEASGSYNEATIRAVYARQRSWNPRGTVEDPGKATRAVFQRLGLIFTNDINPAAVTDPLLQQIQQRFPQGITVAIVPNFDQGVSGRSEFAAQANIFAQNQGSVGLANGSISLGAPVVIRELGDVVEAIQSIHRGLLERWRGAGQTDTSAPPPAWTRIKNLALFSHGESWGAGMNHNNDFSRDGMHNSTRGANPSNIEAFARGVSGAVTADVRVQLFACSTGADDGRSSYEEWQRPGENARGGGNSMGASLATAMGPQASVYAHTTVGHTTENYAARVFGQEAGAGMGGAHVFDTMYPSRFVTSELGRLFPDLTDAEKETRRDSMRSQMWAHFKDAVLGEHNRTDKQKRFSRPMGQEIFVDPNGARELLHNDWTQNWIPSRIQNVVAPRRR